MSKTETTSWRDVIKVHPAADLFPMMTADELKALGEDIRKNGLMSPIVVWTPGCVSSVSLLDGRNRLEACEAAGLLKFDKGGWPQFPWCEGEPIVWLGPDVDPYAFVLSLNIHRRHLTPEQRRDLIAKVLKAQPEKSDRQIAAMVKRDHKTVGAVRAKLEDVGSIPHVAKRTDTKGRKQPAATTPRGERHVCWQCGTRDEVGKVEEHDYPDYENVWLHPTCVDDFEKKLAAERAEAAAAFEVKAQQSDIERVLPDADRLVTDIMARDAIAPGYALAVARGIAAKLGEFPDMPECRRAQPAAASAS